MSFVESFAPLGRSIWAERPFQAPVLWYPNAHRTPGDSVRLFHDQGQPLILSADGSPLGILDAPLNPHRKGLVRASVMADAATLYLSYLGPDDLWL